MIEHPAYTVEEWSVREVGFHLDTLAQSESIFALSNGHIGLRGNLDEGEPHGLPGTYLNSFYELRPLPYAEGGYAYPESGQTTINVTNGKLIRLLVDDEPFDVRYGQLQEHERELDLRIGAAMDHQIEGPPEMVVASESFPDIARVTITTRLAPGQRLRIVKFIAYGWSSVRSRPAILDQVRAALSAARLTGWEGLLAEQRAYLDDFWARADVELEGDPEIQQAARFALFHVLQAGAGPGGRPIPAQRVAGPPHAA